MLDIIISIVTIIYMYFLSRKLKVGLYIGILSQFLWVLFIYNTKSWGLILLPITLLYICISGIVEWEN